MKKLEMTNKRKKVKWKKFQERKRKKEKEEEGECGRWFERYAEAYSELCYTPKMERFAKIVNG